MSIWDKPLSEFRAEIVDQLCPSMLGLQDRDCDGRGNGCDKCWEQATSVMRGKIVLEKTKTDGKGVDCEGCFFDCMVECPVDDCEKGYCYKEVE